MRFPPGLKKPLASWTLPIVMFEPSVAMVPVDDPLPMNSVVELLVPKFPPSRSVPALEATYAWVPAKFTFDRVFSPILFRRDAALDPVPLNEMALARVMPPWSARVFPGVMVWFAVPRALLAEAVMLEPCTPEANENAPLKPELLPERAIWPAAPDWPIWMVPLPERFPEMVAGM